MMEDLHGLLIMEKIGVLYAPNSLDITDQVIQNYNEVIANKGGAEKTN